MTEISYFLSSEEHAGSTLVGVARRVEEAGMRRVWVSDHYHPWNDRQGHSPFVWSVLGAIAATTELELVTTVTCPTFRLHPAVVAQAAATTAQLAPGRFIFGVGSGEALNEQILGDPWPPPSVRLDMLAEAIELMRRLWQGDVVNWDGEHYTVSGARLYTLPDEPIPVAISAFGPKAMDLVVSKGDGWITAGPDEQLLARFRAEGRGPACAGIKVCWHRDEATARNMARALWPHTVLGGRINQDLSRPDLFEAASAPVTEEQVAEGIPCGPDPEVHLAAMQPYLDAGFDELFIHQIGPEQDDFLSFYEKELAPRLPRP